MTDTPPPTDPADVLAALSDDKERPVTVTSDEAIRFAQSVVESVAWEHADEWASECLQVAYRYAAPHDEDCGTEELVEAVARLARPAAPTPDAGGRDALAQALYTMRLSYRWQTWEETSEGQRQWCRDKADQLIAHGWRRVGEGDVVIVNRGVWESIVDDLRQHVSPRRVQAILQSVAALAPEPSDD